MHTLLVVLSVLVGALLPLQAGLNSSLQKYVGHPVFAACANFVVGLPLLLLVALMLRAPVPNPAALGAAPVWNWLGGSIGASLVFLSVVAAPKLGALLLITCLVVGQLSSSLVIDHFGLVGYPVRPLSLTRVLGVALLLLGVLLIQRK